MEMCTSLSYARVGFGLLWRAVDVGPSHYNRDYAASNAYHTMVVTFVNNSIIELINSRVASNCVGAFDCLGAHTRRSLGFILLDSPHS